MVDINKDKIKYVADLARIRLKPEEEALFATQLNDILAYMEKICAIDTSNVEPTSHVIDKVNVLREDIPKKSLSNQEILANAPDSKDGFLKVPRIIE